VVHTQEEATAGDVAIDGESPAAARAMVRGHLDRLAAPGTGDGRLNSDGAGSDRADAELLRG
jgi:hypothetical protein